MCYNGNGERKSQQANAQNSKIKHLSTVCMEHSHDSEVYQTRALVQIHSSMVKSQSVGVGRAWRLRMLGIEAAQAPLTAASHAQSPLTTASQAQRVGTPQN